DGRYVELPGDELAAFFGDTDALMDEIEEFVTGTRTGADGDRVVATMPVTDIVGSTARCEVWPSMSPPGWRPWARRERCWSAGRSGTSSSGPATFLPHGEQTLAGVPGTWEVLAVDMGALPSRV
ncbi:MAG TPA: hypothetical protein VK045_15445, partial [Ornithinicoccus sp.]|nr:hypothetical protein [Ornithinicoccus sp.]